MFYSRENLRIDTNSSVLDSQKVFSGHYWDEFGLTSHLIPDDAKVLMLGLSMGGGVRPILASKKNVELTCVDCDANSLEKCRRFFKDCLSELNFKCVLADAFHYLNTSVELYDAIWVDIYGHSAYIDFTFDQDFYQAIRKRLKPEGVVLVNAFGLPAQFAPLMRAGVQRSMAATISNVFEFVGAIPFRRNMTLIASRQQPKLQFAEPHSALSNLDSVSLATAYLKIQNLRPIDSILQTPELATVSQQSGKNPKEFQTIDHEMRSLWRVVLIRLADYGIRLESNMELLAFIQNRASVTAVLNQAIANQDEFISFIPILAAGESAQHGLEVGWLFDWLFENAESLKSTFPEQYQTIWIPQLWSLQIQSTKYRKYYFRILELINKELA